MLRVSPFVFHHICVYPRGLNFLLDQLFKKLNEEIKIYKRATNIACEVRALISLNVHAADEVRL